ncbi:AzlC family ABC transporter permease [Seohaeicola saemankumensis]|uniref:AzlC family ABC transporter permease n=1 Tax=Seohaeicola saemankumensis TaxID=481181 RepID=UPI001E576DBD|nr:AzlC family ABC transporter permease [Seohaeicola saemankumensis]MCD1626197.1 AzlC family ABC transporter permease [Seohaeicola saemankumensis]
MTVTTTESAYWKGVRDGAPFILVVAPFALLFGVVATETGLNVWETLAFSVVVIAGAAQFTALQLMQENAPTVIVLASALAVNLRMAMYSASLTPHLGATPIWQRALAAYVMVDQSYACSILAYERNQQWTPAQKMAFYFGAVTPVIPVWYAMTVVGALIGSAMPAGLALDFAVPITFIAMIAPALRTVAHIAAALASVILALLFAFVPFNLGLIIAGIGGMMVGAQVELWMSRRMPA